MGHMTSSLGAEKYDMAVIGAGPAGAAAAIQAARAGVRVVVFDKAPYGRDKICGDGLTPRAVGALKDLDIELTDAHPIAGLRMIANKTVRELPWPSTSRFPDHGAVWPRRRLDAALIDAASAAGAEVVWETEALPILDGDRVLGVKAGDRTIHADLVVVACGAPGAVARMLGANELPTNLSVSPSARMPRRPVMPTSTSRRA